MINDIPSEMLIDLQSPPGRNRFKYKMQYMHALTILPQKNVLH